MTTSDLDMAAIMTAANDALAQDAGPPAGGVLAAHQCQTGCGRIANIVMVRIADSDLDILCDVCAMMFFLTLAQAVPDAAPVDDQAPAADTEASTAPKRTGDGPVSAS
jgi:hypothetical protein